MAVMMTLGQIRFSVRTSAYQQLRRVTQYRWAQQERLGASGLALQYVGPGSDAITLDGAIYPHLGFGEGNSIGKKNSALLQLSVMRTEAKSGAPLPLVDGEGNILGDWVIESVEEKNSVFFVDGKPRKIEFTLSLKRYNKDSK